MKTNSTLYLLTLIAFIGVGLRLPFLNYPIDEDYGFYTYPAYFRARGIRILDGYWGGFTPISLWAYIALSKVFGKAPHNIRVGTALFNILNTLAVFYATRTLFSTGEALVASLLFVLFTTSPYLGSFSCNSEGFYILFLALGVSMFSKGALENSNGFLIASAILLSFSFLIKIVNLVFPFLFALFLLHAGNIWGLTTFSFFSISTIFCFTLILLFVYRGKNELFWRQHKIRLGSSLGFKKKNLKLNYKNDVPPIWRESSCVILSSLIFSLFLLVNMRTPQENILLIWFLATLIIIITQGVYLMYHFLPVLQAAVILTAHALGKVLTAYPLFPVLTSCVLTVFFIFFLLNLYRKWNFLKLYRRDKKLPFYQKADQFFYLPEIAHYIKKSSTCDDTVYAWGPFVQIYTLANRKSCEAFLFHFVRPYGEFHAHIFEEIMSGIINKTPKFIILFRPDFDLEVVKEVTGCIYELDKVFFNRYRLFRYVERSTAPLDVKALSCSQKLGLLERLTPGEMDYTIDYTLFETGQTEEGFSEFDKALALHPRDCMVLFGKAAILRKEKKFNEALVIYMDIEHINSKQEGIHLERGVTFLEMGRLEDACLELHVEESMFPGKANTFQVLGITLQRQKKHEEALIMFTKALQKNPSLILSKYNICSVYVCLEQFEQAKNDFKELLQNATTPPSFKGGCGFQLGKIYYQEKEFAKSMTYFQKCLEYIPNHNKAKEYREKISTHGLQDA